MSENNSKLTARRVFVASVFTLLAILFGVAGAMTAIVFIKAENPFTVIVLHTPIALLSILFTVIASINAGKKVILSALIPCIFTLLYIPYESEYVIAAIMSALTVLCCSAVLYRLYTSNTKSSEICSHLSFTAIAFEVLLCVLPMLISALEHGRKFYTVLFERLGGIIDRTVSYISYIFNAASKMYPELESALSGSEINLLKASMTMSLSLMPALIACILFFAILVCVIILDSYNRKTGYVKERTYGIYTVDKPVYIIFNTLTVIYILCFFFGSGFSGFFVGLMSALMFMFPHFAILAYRRLYNLLSKPCGEFFAVIIILAITGIGFIFSLQLLFWVLIFFGTGEYRARAVDDKKINRL